MTIAADKRDIIAKLLSVPPDEMECSQIFRVVAGAGTGKSVLITELARLAADRSILFLSQSRNIADRARISLPKSVRVRTLYSQALSYVEHRYRGKIRRQGGRMYHRLPIPAIMQSGYVESHQIAIAARAAVESWIMSTRPVPDDSDIPDDLKNELGRDALAKAVTGARSVATAQGNPDTDTIPLTYDFIVREWACGRGVIRIQDKDTGASRVIDPLSGANLIVLEEAQDCPPIVYSFLKRQRIALLMLGDPYQSLRPDISPTDYLRPFATSVENITHQDYETLHLDASFRFGYPIASLLNALTHYVAGDTDQDRLRGLGKSSVFTPDRRGHMESLGFHYTFIGRSVITVLREAVRLASQGAELAWVDSIWSYGILSFRDLMAIAMREARIDPEAAPAYQRNLGSFSTLQDAHAHYSRHRDGHHVGLVELCMELQGHMANYLQVIDKMIQQDQRRQQALIRNWRSPPPRHITMTTSTRAKGSEFDRVVLSDDLIPPGLLSQGPMTPQRLASLHHLYTAISRAKYEVVLPADLVHWISQMGFGHARPALATNQISPEERVETPMWHPQFGPSPQILLEMVPENRLRRLNPNSTGFKSSQRGDASGSVNRAFEEELRRQRNSTLRGLESVRAALRSN